MTLIASDSLGDDFINQAKNHDPNGENRMDVSDDWYYNDNEFVTNTMLGKLEDGPETLMAYIKDPNFQPERPHHVYGKAFHCALLEPDDFDSRFFVVDDSKLIQQLSADYKNPRATKKYKEWIEEELIKANGRQQVSVEDYNDMMRMQEKIYSRSQCVDMLKHTLKEKVYKGNLLGLKVKCKADVVNPGHFGLDLKGVKEAPTPQMANKFLYSYAWGRQASFYHDILKVDSFWFLMIEKTYPYTIGLYEVSSEKIQEFREKYEHLLKLYDFHFNQNPDTIKDFMYISML
jgi:exodeoxyribonuclease VIII